MNILMIGGTGNISTDCASLLRAQGHDVSILTRGKSVVPPEYRAVRADRKDPESMRSGVATLELEAVINFIGFDLPELQIDLEVFQGRIRQYIFISSATVYAKPPDKLPIAET